MISSKKPARWCGLFCYGKCGGGRTQFAPTNATSEFLLVGAICDRPRAPLREPISLPPPRGGWHRRCQGELCVWKERTPPASLSLSSPLPEGAFGAGAADYAPTTKTAPGCGGYVTARGVLSLCFAGDLQYSALLRKVDGNAVLGIFGGLLGGNGTREEPSRFLVHHIKDIISEILEVVTLIDIVPGTIVKFQ